MLRKNSALCIGDDGDPLPKKSVIAKSGTSQSLLKLRVVWFGTQSEGSRPGTKRLARYAPGNGFRAWMVNYRCSLVSIHWQTEWFIGILVLDHNCVFVCSRNQQVLCLDGSHLFPCRHTLDTLIAGYCCRPKYIIACAPAFGQRNGFCFVCVAQLYC